MNQSSSIMLGPVLSALLVTVLTGCGTAAEQAEERASTSQASLDADKGQPNVVGDLVGWTTQFPLPGGATSAVASLAGGYSSEVTMDGCRFMAVTHVLPDSTTAVGVRVEYAPGPYRCRIVKLLGGPGYLPVRTYPGTLGFIYVSGHNGMLGIATAGSSESDPNGSSEHHVYSFYAPFGTLLRHHSVSLCQNPGFTTSIVPTSVSFAGGTLVAKGYKNTSLGFGIDAPCGSSGLTSAKFTLTYGGFAGGGGTVPTPTFTF